MRHALFLLFVLVTFVIVFVVRPQKRPDSSKRPEYRKGYETANACPIGCESDSRCKTKCSQDTGGSVETAKALTADTDFYCAEAKGLVRLMAKDGSRNVWQCFNFTPYADYRGDLLGGNCSGGTGVLYYSGRLRCECPPTVDYVTGKRYETRQIQLNNTELCVVNKELYETD